MLESSAQGLQLLQGLQALNEFHFLRPWWLIAILPAIILTWLLFRSRQQAGRWQTVIAPDLLPFLLDGKESQQKHQRLVWSLIFWSLASLAMAGPSWTKIPLPIHKQQSPLVILLDLSPSMLAEDLKPNRLTRARLKLTDLLSKRSEGTTALIAYANDAHIVTPLTDDTATIISLIPSLHPNIMPSAGSRPVAALQKGLEIILQAGHQGGDLLLISDGITDGDVDAMTELVQGIGGFRLSVLALGSEAGAPIPLETGGFVKNRKGDIVIAQRSSKLLRKLARENDGQYVVLSADDSDLNALTAGIDNAPDTETLRLQRTFDTWQDNGFWLVLISLPIILAAFRRNLIALFIIAPVLLYSESSTAFEWADLDWTGLDWAELWQTADQRGQQAFGAGDTESAEEYFQNPKWKGASAYRNDNYDDASKAFGQDPSPTGQYNLGNSLAKTGQLEQAIAAYSEALAAEPHYEDATFNKRLVEELLKQEKQNQDQNQEQGKDGSKSDSDKQSSDDQNQGEAEQGDSEEESPQQKDSQQKDQDNSEEESSDNESDKKPPEPDTGQQDPQNPEQQPTNMNEQESDLSNEQRQAMEQWLRRVPDDPGGLLRRKFKYEAWLQQQSGSHNKDAQEAERW